MVVGFACSGDRSGGERFTQFQTVIRPAGPPAIGVSETIDFNSGAASRHGIFRLIPTDFGEPTDLEVSSDDAPDDVELSRVGRDVQVRIGDPDVTFQGRRRYHVSYVLPDARYSVGDRLAVDLFGDLDFRVDKVRGVLAGFELSSPECYVGELGSTEECELVETQPGVYEVHLDDVARGDFVTLEGTVERTVDVGSIDIDPPPEPAPSTHRDLLGGGASLLGGSLAAMGIYRWSRRKGSNEIAAEGAAAAAFPAGTGNHPPPTSQPHQVTMVTDAELAEMATTEFVPPAGIAPWEGAVLLSETLNASTVKAYVSSLVGAGVIELHPVAQNKAFGMPLGNDLAITVGSNYTSAPIPDQQWAYDVLSIRNPYITGTYDQKFAYLMGATEDRLQRQVEARRWWTNGPKRFKIEGQAAIVGAVIVLPVLFLIAFVLVPVLIISEVPIFGRWWTWMLMTALAIIGSALFALVAYAPMRLSRTAEGSALALRTESFRRFLHHSEAQHVEWAWKQGVLREYSAWAVALGEADAWTRALNLAPIPPQPDITMPLLVGSLGYSFDRSTTRPSSSGGGSSGGGFSGGGSAGGGGGGGGGGSW